MGNQNQDPPPDPPPDTPPPADKPDRKKRARDRSKALEGFLGNYKAGDVIGAQELAGMKRVAGSITKDLDDEGVATADEDLGIFSFGSDVK